jgi:hypothetical protein
MPRKPPPDSPIGSLTGYLERIKQVRAYWGLDKEKRRGDVEDIWFRGHALTHWKLTPKFYRREYRESDEAEIRQEFQFRAQQLIQGSRLPTDKWEWYFLMQHYGAPTRLLDWTDNPLVALYFALYDPKLDDYEAANDAAVWVLNPWWLNRRLDRGIQGAMLSDWDEADAYLPDLGRAFSGTTVRTRKPAAIDPPHVDRRLAAQGSRFVIFGADKDLMRTKAGRSKRVSARHLTKITINRRATKALRLDLELCGITRPLLFPDLQALCDDICRKWRNPI